MSKRDLKETYLEDMKSKKKKKPTPPRPPLDLSALRDRSSMQSCDVVDLISPVKSSRPEYGDGDLSLKVEGADDDETEGADNKLMMKGLTLMDTPLVTSDWRAVRAAHLSPHLSAVHA